MAALTPQGSAQVGKECFGEEKMKLEIRPIRKKDYSKVIQFAIDGMHFERYMNGRTFQKLYGRYFWYSELNRASRVIAAYYGEEFVGVLLADLSGEKKRRRTLWIRAYVGLVDAVQRLFFRDSVGPYEEVNQAMLEEFRRAYQADGEINFLAADLNAPVKGIGTALLEELERQAPGKRVYVYTDSNCSYQFYEHRGFDRVGERRITMEFSDVGSVPLDCYLYTKVL